MDNQQNQEKPHKRRVRYSGTHPKSYKEKYKEHNPENLGKHLIERLARDLNADPCLILCHHGHGHQHYGQ